MADTMTFLNGGFPWIPVDFKVEIFYEHTNNYCFICVPMTDTMTFLHKGVPVGFHRFQSQYILRTQ